MRMADKALEATTSHVFLLFTGALNRRPVSFAGEGYGFSVS